MYSAKGGGNYSSAGCSGLERIASGYSSGAGCASYAGSGLVSGSYSAGGRSAGEHKSYMMAEAVQQFNSFAPSQMYSIDEIKKEVKENIYRADNNVTQTYSPSVNGFLNPGRALAPFVNHVGEIKEFIEEAFFKLIGREFPDDIAVHILSEEDMTKIHPRDVLGFAINRKNSGLMSEVFVKKGQLDKTMLIIGHELGHVMTRRLDNDKDEEAKAFAFAMAWGKAIKENNIANLSTAIRLETPARNGLHDVAFDFVLNLVRSGIDAFNLFSDLAGGRTKVGEML